MESPPLDHRSFLAGYTAAHAQGRCELAELALRFASEIETLRGELSELRRRIEEKFPAPPSTSVH
jgi:hypothetical protein